MQSDLHKIIVSPQPLSADHAKVFLYQILRGRSSFSASSFCFFILTQKQAASAHTQTCDYLQPVCGLKTHRIVLCETCFNTLTCHLPQPHQQDLNTFILLAFYTETLNLATSWSTATVCSRWVEPLITFMSPAHVAARQTTVIVQWLCSKSYLWKTNNSSFILSDSLFCKSTTVYCNLL